ncbi:hypothetical protein PVAND_001389 [Polypedilum vanderplanki]|uniref:DUF4485 domain-containing protein n=1 Tax=Polypedilum vanderplanki TaxID=319348 RepID=A0A9J6BN28_POLVA|nr:hypothetical protein PVAND_001389 [Polypedilum vanderplanki]
MATAAKVTAQSYNMRYLMFKSKIQENLSKLSNEDKQLVARWVEKLNSFCTKMSDLEMRNNIIMNLLFQTQTGKLQKPFTSPPTFSSLEKVGPIQDMDKDNLFPEDLRLPLIMQNSPDHGAFLVSQPVPKCGAFAYIAIVSRPMNK